MGGGGGEFGVGGSREVTREQRARAFSEIHGEFAGELNELE